MKKYILIPAMVLLAISCQRAPVDVVEDFPPLQETNLQTVVLPETNREVLLFKSEPDGHSGTNLFEYNAAGNTAYLPTGYYYVPAGGRNDLKPALLPSLLLVQKGSSLAFFNTTNKKLTTVSGIAVPSWANVVSLYSMTGGDTLLIALIERDQFASPANASQLYRINITNSTAKQINNPIADELSAPDNRFPLMGALYDASHNRILNIEFERNAGYKGIESFDLTTGQRSELAFPGFSNATITGQYITIRGQDKASTNVTIVDTQLTNLKLEQFSVPAQEAAVDSDDNSFIVYAYVGNDYMLGTTYKQDGITLTVLKKQKDTFKVIQIADSRYAFVKGDGDNLYLVISAAADELKTEIAIYNFASNSFTSRVVFPSDVFSGSIEFLK